MVFVCAKKIQLESDYLVLKMFINHLFKKWNIKKSTVFSLACLIITSISLPILISYFFFTIEIQITYSIITYLIFIFWVISMLILIHPLIFDKLKENTDYAIKLALFIKQSHDTMIDEYNKYNKVLSVTQSRNMMAYDLIVVNIAYSLIFELYFNNIDKSLENVRFLYVNSDIVSLLRDTKKLDTFYGNIFFHSDSAIDDKKYEKIKIKLIDKIINKISDKKWFKEYYNNIEIFKLIDHTINTWWNNVVFYSSQLKINTQEKFANM